MLTPTELLLLLQRLPETGSATYWRLLEAFPNLKTAMNAPIGMLSNLLTPAACQALSLYREQGESSELMRQVRRDLVWLEERKIHILDTHHEFYPKTLREIKRAPPVLYVWGDPAVLSMPQIAIVGSRNPTPDGRENAYHFAKELAANGVTVTSGLALGIDVAAHTGAVAAKGRTIAVLGTGIDQIYPIRHKQLAQDIVDARGAIVSEFPLGSGPIAANFPQRNRIISGLSFGVLVVEAAVKSGSLITARYALQQDREVFAIPGSIHSPLSKGCHEMIKQGAKLVESAKDITDEIQGFLSMKWQEIGKAPSQLALQMSEELMETEHEQTVLDHIHFDPVSFDVLISRTGLGAGELMATLLTMEVRGMIGNNGNGYVRSIQITGAGASTTR